MLCARRANRLFADGRAVGDAERHPFSRLSSVKWRRWSGAFEEWEREAVRTPFDAAPIFKGLGAKDIIRSHR